MFHVCLSQRWWLQPGWSCNLGGSLGGCNHHHHHHQFYNRSLEFLNFVAPFLNFVKGNNFYKKDGRRLPRQSTVEKLINQPHLVRLAQLHSQLDPPCSARALSVRRPHQLSCPARRVRSLVLIRFDTRRARRLRTVPAPITRTRAE